MAGEGEIRAAALARGRARKHANALATVVCGGLPAALLGWLWPTEPWQWIVGFLTGLVWANAFEYIYHRWLLHLPGGVLARRHLRHHATVGTLTEAEHVNLGASPLWVALLFAVNGAPVVTADWLLGLHLALGMFLGFVVYLLAVEEVHWRVHVGGWLPPGARSARLHHLAHHDRPDQRFNVFLPIFDWLFGTARS
jgi:hypothetical protein